MARDLIHQACREASEKDGWTITSDPFQLIVGDNIRLQIDMEAEKIFEAEKEGEKIFLEVKSFLQKSKITDFYAAKGQYDVYKEGLEEEGYENPMLYLAIEEDTYKTFFQDPFIQKVVAKNAINLLVFNQNTKEITLWIKN